MHSAKAMMRPTSCNSGSGNQKNVLSGFTYNVGDWQIGPNFLWQKPIVGPIPGSTPEDGAPELAVPRNLLYDASTGTTTCVGGVLGEDCTKGQK